MDPDTHLARVLDSEARASKARDELRQAIREAVEAGVPRSRIAEAAKTSRVTLWRWLNDEGRPA